MYYKKKSSEQKLDKNKIIISDAELEKVQIDGLVAHLSDDHSLYWDEDFVLYGRNVQEKIKAKEFEPTFAKHILDFEKIQEFLACKAFPKYSPLGLCRYHEFCFKYGWYQEFPNKQHIPPLQNLIANPPTLYDIQEFQDMQKIAISSYINGKYTFISMRTGVGKTMCYWISAILRRGLTVVISPLVSLIDDQINNQPSKGPKVPNINDCITFEDLYKKVTINIYEQRDVEIYGQTDAKSKWIPI
ncbi:hypothetical protein C1646_676385 [Rhizophagus diaphanus]|nr:hypothetical protein C1646_676385 [Rhizophagus diaphanus] [Rhizophagus sp. MUCL 43196]